MSMGFEGSGLGASRFTRHVWRWGIRVSGAEEISDSSAVISVHCRMQSANWKVQIENCTIYRPADDWLQVEG
jgi:hypothetical protein